MWNVNYTMWIPLLTPAKPVIKNVLNFLEINRKIKINLSY